MCCYASYTWGNRWDDLWDILSVTTISHNHHKWMSYLRYKEHKSRLESWTKSHNNSMPMCGCDLSYQPHRIQKTTTNTSENNLFSWSKDAMGNLRPLSVFHSMNWRTVLVLFQITSFRHVSNRKWIITFIAYYTFSVSNWKYWVPSARLKFHPEVWLNQVKQTKLKDYNTKQAQLFCWYYS